MLVLRFHSSGGVGGAPSCLLARICWVWSESTEKFNEAEKSSPIFLQTELLLVVITVVITVRIQLPSGFFFSGVSSLWSFSTLVNQTSPFSSCNSAAKISPQLLREDFPVTMVHVVYVHVCFYSFTLYDI